jgi:hypothetical protein
MNRFVFAFKAWFWILFDKGVAARLGKAYTDEVTPAAPAVSAKPATVAAAVPPAAPVRSEAVTLLAVLQREARLVDFLKEDIAAYADAQVGAAARDVHRDAAAALERLFALRPVAAEGEGADVPIPASLDAARMRLVGNVAATPPAKGRLQHAGWQATKVELPQYTGNADAARVVAPAEVEV